MPGSRGPIARLRSLWLNLSLARKGIIVAALPVLTILIAAFPIALNDTERIDANDDVRHTLESRDYAGRVFSYMQEAEAHMLGFLLSDADSSELQTLKTAVDSAKEALSKTDSLVQDSASRSLVRLVRTKVATMETEMENEVHNASRQRPSAASSLLLMGQESRKIADLRRATDDLKKAQDLLLKQREQRLNAVRNRNRYLAALVLLLGVLGTGASAVLFMSGVAERVGRLQASATGLADDTESHHVVGKDELGQLAVAIQENLQETALAAERLRMAIRAAHIEVIEIRPAQDRIAVVGSGNVFRRMGYAVDEIPKTLDGFIETIHVDDRERVASALRNVTPGWEYVVEFRMDASGIDWRWMELRGAAPPAEQDSDDDNGQSGRGRAAVGVLLDVTERKTAEEQVRTAMTAADRANKAKSEFLSRMSHELRTPLNAVLGFAQLLEIEALTADQKESVSHILRGGRYLLNLINEVLDLARIEAGRFGLSIEPVSIREVLSGVVALISPQAAEFGVRLYFPPPPRNDFAKADRQRLQQVLLNLLSNAIKYNRRGGSVELAIERGGGKVCVLVKDTGSGMSSAQMERLFQPFERLDAARTGVEGTGLGLALSRTIVEAMGGRILVESQAGVGSTFTVELDEGQAPEEQIEAPLVSPPGGYVTVLYVEDNQANVRLVERVVGRRPNLRLVTIGDGDRALETIRLEKPSLVMLDLNLPGLSGDVVLQQMRENPATTDIPVAILSADATPSQVARLRSLGAQYYLTKPIDVVSLLEVLDECLGGANAA